MEFYGVKKFGRIHPADIVDAEVLQRMKEGEEYKIKVTMPRNVGFHRKFFKMLGVVYENLPEGFSLMTTTGEEIPIKNTKDILKQIKWQTGHFDYVYTIGGKRVPELKSIAFDAMDQPAFEKFYSEAIDVILKYFLRGVDKQDFQEELIMRFG